MLRHYSETERGRLQIIRNVHEAMVENDYYEQSPNGNVHNFLVEVFMSNKTVQLSVDDKPQIEMLRRCADNALDDAIEIIKKEKINC